MKNRLINTFFFPFRWLFRQLGRAKYALSCFFFPRQRWLTKKIPKTWCDKVELVPLVLFEILKNFVEDEEGLNQLDLDWETDVANGWVSREYVDSVSADYIELKEAYTAIVETLPLLEKKEIELLDALLDSGMKYGSEEWIAHSSIEKEIEDLKMKTLQTIIKHYQILWT
jgi:hypothetical protein